MARTFFFVCDLTSLPGLVKWEYMEKIILDSIIEELDRLHTDLFFAEHRDRRSKEKNIREVKQAISTYAQSLPQEVLGYLDTKVGSNALNYQWCAADIGRSISFLKEWRKSLPDE